MKKFNVSYKFTTKESEFENNGYGLDYNYILVNAESAEGAIDLFCDYIKDNSANMIDFEKTDNSVIVKTLLSNGEIQTNYYLISGAVMVKNYD